DPNKERREAVKRKITQYLRRAEEIFNCHLQRAAGGGNSIATGYSSLRFRPIRTLSSAVENLRRCKVVGVIDKVQIVQDPATGGTFILKSLPKSHVETRERQTIIPHGVPFMVKLLCYYVSEDSIFLHLEHVQGETLWSHLRSKYRVQQGSADSNTIQALRDRGREHGVGSSPGSSQVSIFSARTGSGLPGSATHQVLGNTNALPPQEPSPDPRDPGLGKQCRLRLAGTVAESTEPSPDPRDPGLGKQCRLRLAWPSGLRAAPGGQDLSMTQAMSGIVDRVPAASAKGPGHFTNQGLVVYPWDALTSGMGCEQVQLWAAEILLALEGLHQQGVLCRDLNPRNLLLDAAGHVRLTFFGQWTEVEPQCCSQAREELYSAPEVGGIVEPTEAADCWSFGSLLYELLTGVPLSRNHPSGIQPHTQLHLPEGLSLAATSLLTELLQYNPKQRLGSGGGGMAKLKSHSFFSTIPWNKLVG
ncbi:PREDICTED: ribosomal protein S6 kinase-like 1, partial [Fulmarus glacialis]|uniref:ribosomal protein S6 kinase-like 1 n=1 Tax=Fulmarus glacialis TaxID=30455 RepID=UPI00051BE4DB